jgi:hypothetical protein
MAARDCRAAWALALALGCATAPSEPHETRTAPGRVEAAPSPAAAPPAAPVDADADDLAELEDDLAAYEQQLARNESRLRAFGVVVAQAEPSPERPADAATKLDARFAEPPPPRPSAPPSPVRSERAKKTAASPKAGGAAAARPTPSPTADEELRADPRGEDRCAELCGLAESTCDLESKICDLAERHPGDPRYVRLCQRAGEDCRLAADACTRCSP